VVPESVEEDLLEIRREARTRVVGPTLPSVEEDNDPALPEPRVGGDAKRVVERRPLRRRRQASPRGKPGAHVDLHLRANPGHGDHRTEGFKTSVERRGRQEVGDPDRLALPDAVPLPAQRVPRGELSRSNPPLEGTKLRVTHPAVTLAAA
jgi:hypothetical protein